MQLLFISNTWKQHVFIIYFSKWCWNIHQYRPYQGPWNKPCNLEKLKLWSLYFLTLRKLYCCCCCCIASVVSDSVRSHRQQPTRLPHPWDSPGKNTGVGCHFLLQCMKVKRESEVAQPRPTLGEPMDSSLPGSSIHGIFQAWVLEWVAIAFSEGNYTKYQ